jgi:hypothetical protein
MSTLQLPVETVILNQIKTYHGTAFQEFGDRLLNKLYPDEYIAVRAGGSWGDLKNDGYCHINRTFFHFYSTSQHNVALLKSKISSDIDGCLTKQQQVEKIVFVTNDANLGVIEAHIDELRLKHGIVIDTWGPNRLVEIICELPPADIAGLFNMVLTEEKTDDAMIVRYVFNATPEETISRKKVKRNGRISILSFILFPLVLFFAFTPLPFGWYCLILFVLLCFGISCYKYIHFSKLKPEGEAIIYEGLFYFVQGENIVSYFKAGHCPHPHCEGLVVVREPPQKEQHRFSMVGLCTKEPAIHTFTYNKDNIGYPVQLDFSQPEK